MQDRRDETCDVVHCLGGTESPRLPADLLDRAESASQPGLRRVEHVTADLNGETRNRRLRHFNDQGRASGRPGWLTRPLGDEAVVTEFGDQHAHPAAAETQLGGNPGTCDRPALMHETQYIAQARVAPGACVPRRSGQTPLTCGGSHLGSRTGPWGRVSDGHWLRRARRERTQYAQSGIAAVRTYSGRSSS